MYIREYKTKNKKTKSVYVTHRLVEAYRDGSKVRQRIIMHLGTLDLPKAQLKELAYLLTCRISGQMSVIEENNELTELVDSLMQHHHFKEQKREEIIIEQSREDLTPVNLDTVSTAASRTLGPEIVANTMWERLGMDEILKECRFQPKQVSIAKALILGRLISPGSELKTWRWFNNTTSLTEMMDYDIKDIGKDAFYETGDLLLEHKKQIELLLSEREKIMFMLEKRVFLYDLTNTYFEGSAKNNSDAKFGVSKENRYDCPLVALAVMVDEHGFPVFSQIYPGNKSEPQTLPEVLDRLETDIKAYTGSQKPVLVMDRGIATANNIEIIRQRQYDYTLVSRKKNENKYKDDFTTVKQYMDSEDKVEIPDDWEKADKPGNVLVKKISGQDTCTLLVASSGRCMKERSMDSLKEQRFLEDISRLHASFKKGNILIPGKICERIGRLRQKYPSICKYYDIEVKLSEDQKKVAEICWDKKTSREQRNILSGCYVIETTQQHLTGPEIWEQYMLLNRVESVFKDLKSELGMRPVYHQTDKRTESHLFIGVLAYHILNAIETALKAKGDTREWKTIKEVLNTHVRNTVVMSGKDMTWHIRVSGTPESQHLEIYNALKVKDPLKRNKQNIHLRL